MPRFLFVICTLMILTAVAYAVPRTLDLPGPDKAVLDAEDTAREADLGGPERFAWPADLSLTAGDGEGWDRLPGGEHRWQLVVRAPGSLSLGFGFSRFHLPWGGRLIITGTHGPERVFTAADNRDHGELWTPVVLGDRAVLTLALPAGHRDDFALELTRVGRGYRVFGEPAEDKSGACNIDVICEEGDAWRKEIRSVGVYQVGATWKCTGVMINNTVNDGRPYFLTANHCGVTDISDQTVVVYWNFESPECGLHGAGSLEDTQSGASWRAAWSLSDMTLLELAPPDTSWHVTYSGWDRSGDAVAKAVTIHHPSTDEKSISFEDDPLQVTSYSSNTVPGDGTHLRVVDWDLGTTEPGSSGCPLYDPEHRIIGQLHGGYAACGNDESDWYGRLSVSWNGGGTPDTQLASWLDPSALGLLVLDTFDPNDPDQPPVDPPPETLLLRGAVPNPAVDAPPRFWIEMPRDGHAKLTIYDLLGRHVAVALDGVLPAGIRRISWDDPSVPSGVYFARLEALGETQTQAFTLVR